MTVAQPQLLVRARNSFRPFFKPKIPRPYWKQIQAVRSETPVAALPMLLDAFEANPNYSFPGFGNSFPKARIDAPNANLRMLRPLPIKREMYFQIARINHYKTSLISAVCLISELDHALIEGRLSDARELINRIEESFGSSVVVAKKRLLLSLLEDGLAGLGREFDRVTAGAPSTAWALICRYIYDASDPSYFPTHASHYWLEFCKQRPHQAEYYTRIVSDNVVDYFDESGFASSILRHSTLSLIDLTFFIWRRTHSFNFSSSSLSDLRLDTNIGDVLSENFSNASIVVPEPYYSPQVAPDDYDIFRTSLFFSEYANVARWRSELGFLMYAPISDVGSLPTSFTPLTRYFAPERFDAEGIREGIAESVIPAVHAMLPRTQILREYVLTETTLVAYFIRNSLKTLYPLPDKVADLILSRQDMFLHLREDEIDDYLGRVPGGSLPRLCEFALRDVVYRRKRTLDNELERRLAFMSMFDNGSASQIVPYLDITKERSPDAALAIAAICTRPFLERLYMMVSSVKDVLDTRLAICGWIINNTERIDDTLLEEYDAIEREISTLDIRSELDSTRVHVDEESLKLWFYSTQVTTLTRYAKTIFAEGNTYRHGSLLQFYSRHNASDEADPESLSEETQIGSEFLLLDMVDKTLNAFARDKSFGLDAYLSRRIRHGTLRGQLLTPLMRHLNKRIDDTDLDEDDRSILRALITDWSDYLRGAIDNVRKEIIQIVSAEHPNGLIRASWRSAGNIAHVDAMVARVRQRTLDSRADYDPFPDIHSLCWDCIEPDLAQLRRYMVKTFLPDAQVELLRLLSVLNQSSGIFHIPGIKQDAMSQLNSRVQEICGWFIRPVFRRDKYSLDMLISSTLSIVRELSDDYKFTSEIACSNEITLSRASFDVFSDVLFVLVGNAAAHGLSGGHIFLSADIIDRELNIVRLRVTSELETTEARDRAVERINAAADVHMLSAIERAAVEEGFSGLRKIVGLLNRVRSKSVRMEFLFPDDVPAVIVEVHLPAEIIAQGRLSS